MTTYVVNTAAGVGPTDFFPTSGVTRGASSPTSITYNIGGSRTVVVTGTGFTFDGTGTPTAGLITGVQLKQGATQLAAFTAVNNRSLVTFDDAWLNDNNQFRTFAHLVPGNDTLTGGLGDDAFVGGQGNDTINGGAGNDEAIYRGDGRTQGVTVDLDNGNAADQSGQAWEGTTATPGPGAEVDILTSIEQAFGTNFADVLTGDNHDNAFSPAAADVAGVDTVAGGLGFDEIRFDRPGDATLNGITAVFTADGTGTVTGLPPVAGQPKVNTSFTGIESVRGTTHATRSPARPASNASAGSTATTSSTAAPMTMRSISAATSTTRVPA